MNEWLLTHEGAIRLGFLFGIVAIMTLWEIRAPRRTLTVSKFYRWSNNWGIVILNTVLLRLIFPAAAVGLAFFVESQGWGLFHSLDWPFWLTVALSIIILDFVIWGQHVMFHAVPVLWRFHRMHHADLDIDLTTGLRFHPFEILLSMGIKGGAITVLGAPAVAVLIFEVILNGLALFNHANVRIPCALDRVLRWFVVTPDMHRVHHSWYPHETNSNFGFNLPWWDRLLGTYRDQPQDGHEAMTIGLNTFRDLRWERLDRMLIQPFVGLTNNYPSNIRNETNRPPTDAPPSRPSKR